MKVVTQTPESASPIPVEDALAIYAEGRVLGNFLLMHMDLPVAEFTMTKNMRGINVTQVLQPEHLPLGTRQYTGVGLNMRIRQWMLERMPDANNPFRRLLEAATGLTMEECVVATLGVSLEDTYWFCPASKQYEWKNIDFRNVHFASPCIDLLFRANDVECVNIYSPDLTTPGASPKGWLFTPSGPVLFKSGHEGTAEEALNEVVADVLEAAIKSRTSTAKVGFFKRGIYCAILPCFVPQGMDLIPLESLLSDTQEAQPDALSATLQKYNFLQASITDVRLLDFILGNQARQLQDFCVLRDARTLELLPQTPLFSFGQCSPDVFSPGASFYLNNEILEHFWEEAEFPETFPSIEELSRLISPLYASCKMENEAESVLSVIQVKLRALKAEEPMSPPPKNNSSSGASLPPKKQPPSKRSSLTLPPMSTG